MRARYEAIIDKRRAVKKAEDDGVIADSLEVRMALMARVRSGEITIEECQSELAKIKRQAKRKGLKTRSQAYRAG